MKYERLYIDEIDDAVMLPKHAEEERLEYNTIRPHEALAWNRPLEVYLRKANASSSCGAGTVCLNGAGVRNP